MSTNDLDEALRLARQRLPPERNRTLERLLNWVCVGAIGLGIAYGVSASAAKMINGSLAYSTQTLEGWMEGVNHG